MPRAKDGIDHLQWADHVQSFRDACVYAASITSPDAAGSQIHEAIAAAYDKRGVALLNIPQDVFGAKTAQGLRSAATLRPAPEILPAPADLDAAACLIDGAGTTALFVGYGGHPARDEILALADRLKAPIVHTYRALDLFPFDDPRVVGGLGMIGSSAGYDAVHQCDLLVMIGSDYPYTEFLPEKAKVVQIDERAFAIGRRLPVAQAVVGSSRPAVQGLLDRVAPKADARFLERTQKTWADWRRMLDGKADPERSRDRIHPQALARTVSDLADADAVFCVDTGAVALWTGNWLRPTGRQQITGSFNNAAVGTALGMANGVQALDRGPPGDRDVRRRRLRHADAGVLHRGPARPADQVRGVQQQQLGPGEAGDGGGGPAGLRGRAVRQSRLRPIRASLRRRWGVRIDKPSELRQGIQRALATPGPVVVDVKVDADELPSLPHIDPAQAWKFGIGKARELIGR